MEGTSKIAWRGFVRNKSGIGISLIATGLFLAGTAVLVWPGWQPSIQLLFFHSLFLLGLPVVLLIGGVGLQWRDSPAEIRLWAFIGYLSTVLLAILATAGAILTIPGLQLPHPWNEIEIVLRNANVGGLFGFFLGASYGQVIHTRQIQAELERKTEALDAAPFGVVITDPALPDNPISYTNEQFLRITGYEKDEVLGRNCRFLQGENTAPEPVAQIRQAIDDAAPVTATLRNYRKDGTEFWNRVSIAPVFDDDGTVESFVGFQENVTELQEYERTLERQRDNLKLLNGVVRHDIRNDLQLVTAYTELLENHVDEAGKEYLDTVQESASNAIDLTTTARELAEVMLQSDRELQPVDVGVVLTEQVTEARSAFPEADISIEGPVPQTTVEADEFLQSVFQNLLHNAVQHNDKDQTQVTVTAERVEEFLEVRFADNGTGIPDGQKEDIFGKEEKGLESEGTGIGLYLVRSLIEAYDGDVWVEDNDPTGAVFVVQFPISPIGQRD